MTVFASVFLESSAAPNTFFGAMADKAGATVAGLGNHAGNAIADAGKLVDKVVGKTVETVEDGTKGVVNKVDKDIKIVIEGIGKLHNDLKATLEKFTEAIAALGGEIGKKVEKDFIQVKSHLEELIKLDEKFVKAIAEGDYDTAKVLGEAIKILVTKIKAIIARVIEILGQILEKSEIDVANVIALLQDILAKVDVKLEDFLSKVNEILKSTPTKVLDGPEKVDEGVLAENLEKEIKTFKVALAAFEDAVKKEEENLAKTDEEKELKLNEIKKVDEWLKKYVTYVEGVHKELRDDVKGNDHKNREKMIKKVSEAIENTEDQVNEMKKTQTDVIKEAFDKYFLGIIVGGAIRYIKLMEKSMGIENNAV